MQAIDFRLTKKRGWTCVGHEFAGAGDGDG